MAIEVDKSSDDDANNGVAVKADDNPNDEVTNESKKKCKYCDLFDGNANATGYSVLAMGRGMLVMSNILMSSALLWLASDAAGCFEDEDTEPEACTKEIYGFIPASYITNIAVFSGLASAIMMPVFGAYVDFTSHRKTVGIISAALMIAIQAVQIYTTASTWFAMSILQAVAVVCYQLQMVAIFAYMPEIAREVGEKKMTVFSSHFTAIQFAAQVLFLVVIGVIQSMLKASAVLTAQISQGMNTVTSSIFFGIGWFKYMTPRPPARDLPKDENLFTIGFKQNWNTARNIQRYFKKGLRWYFLALCFAESCRSFLLVSDLSKIELQRFLTSPLFFPVFLILCEPK